MNVMIWVHIAAHFLNWGQRDYLLKAFSLQPADAGNSWRQAFTTRALLFPIVAAGFVIFTPDHTLAALLLLWVAARYVWSSYDVWVVYNRKFPFALGVELGVLSIVIAGILFSDNLSLQALVGLLLTADLGKAIMAWLWFRKEVPDNSTPNITPAYFRQALPFFLISFSGLLQSRIDMLCVNVLLSPDDKAVYQVLINLLLAVITLPALVITPFLKNFYRGSETALQQLRSNMALAGVLIVPIAVFCIYWFLERVYLFPLQPIHGILGALYVWPVFYYAPIIFALFKEHKQNQVVKTTFACIVINFIIALSLIPTQGITGALTAAMVGQWCMLGSYFWINRKMVS